MSDVIGAYRLHEVLGEGGMGTVYRATQTDPVRREVALKLIKAGMDTAEVVARFRAERQALAVMNHASIARVFDAGATEAGRLYFVMELVRGVPIDEYCDVNKLDVASRIQLFVRVCEAVHHAHQKGIVHRDLKPSNVLVAIEGTTPRPKVIDFGIAKALGSGVADETRVTALGQMLGTPAYMSPEQAEGSGLDIDTRTDVYALGVMLYELLSGDLPYEPKALRRPDFVLQYLLRERPVPTPSARFGSLADTQRTVARNRGTDVHTLRRALRGDLDWIVMKAMEKDRTRRYDAASELGADLRRYLDGEPVAARPPSTLYRLGKFAGRHRGFLAAGIAVLVVLVAGTVVSTVGFVQADRNAALASAAADRAGAVSDFLDRMLRAADPVQGGTSETTVREVLDAASEEVAGGAFADQPLVEAAVRRSIGGTYLHLGLVAEAETHLEAALSLLETTSGAHPTELVQIVDELGRLRRRQGDPEAAVVLYRRALALADSGGSSDDHGDGELAVNDVRNNLGLVLQDLDRMDEAARVLEDLAESERRLLAPDDINRATTLNNLALVKRAQGDIDGAIAAFEETLTILRAAVGERHVYVAAVLESIGALDRRMGRYGRADSLMQMSLGMRREILGAQHPDIVNGLNGLGLLHIDMGELDRAEAFLDEALQMSLELHGEAHPRTALVLNNLGLVHLGRADGLRAREAFRRAVSIREEVLGGQHRNTLNARANLASALLLAGETAEAEQLAGDVVRTERATGLADVELVGSALRTWGRSLTGLERFDEAEAALLEAHAMESAELGEDHTRTQSTVEALIALYRAWGREDDLTAWVRRRSAV